jgi:hypothetical protein
MAFFVGVVILVLVLSVAAYFVLRDQAIPSKHEVAREFDPAECARSILEALPPDSRQRLGTRGALEVVSYVLDYIKLAGAVANGADTELSPERTVILGGATSAEYLVERASASGLEVSSAEALAAMEASIEYLARIGAIGPTVKSEESR